jgi:hypothetical protein
VNAERPAGRPSIQAPGGLATEQQHPAEGQREGVDHPFHASAGKPERADDSHMRRYGNFG